MRFKQSNPTSSKFKYRLYSPSSLQNAYKFVREKKVSVCKAAKIYGIPEQTLRDRVKGKIDPECVTTGREPVLSMFEEAKIVEHLKFMAKYGYGYTKQETVDIASAFALQLGKRTSDNPLSFGWFEGFRNRWPELKVQKPRALEHVRAKMASRSTVNEYFCRLKATLTKYDLADSPHLIFNVDEKGISMDHKPPYIVHASSNPPAVTTGRSKTITILGCGSASGVAIPPYYVFPGKRMLPELLDGSSPGADGTVSETGWSNSFIFRNWIEHHFLKFIPSHSTKPVLLIVDGHKSHVSVGLAEWAIQHNIIIFVLPAHCSHILQPLDVGCYGPLQKIYSNECHKFMRQTSATISRYNVCELSSKAYCRALCPENLQSSYRKCGIYPFNKEAINEEYLIPAEIFDMEDSSDDSQDTVEGGISETSYFMKIKENNFKKVKRETTTKKRNTMSKIVSGKELSETVLLDMKEHEKNQKPTKKAKNVATPLKNPKVIKKGKSVKSACKTPQSPQPGPSRINIDIDEPASKLNHFSNEDSIDEVDDEVEDEPCCVCGLHQPIEMTKKKSIEFAQWAQCDGSFGGMPCLHWVHLKYCCPTSYVAANDKFFCPHCVDFEI